MTTKIAAAYLSATYVALWVKFDEELLPLEAKLSDFRPGERVDLGGVLEDNDAHMSDSQIQRQAFVILQNVGQHVKGGIG